MQSRPRLFVPLATDPFRWFQSGKKKWELRKYGNQYTENNIYSGRIVELRRGYNTDDSLWGSVDEVKVYGSIEEVYAEIKYEEIIPVACDLKDALEITKNILSSPPNSKYLCFKVSINSGSK